MNAKKINFNHCKLEIKNKKRDRERERKILRTKKIIKEIKLNICRKSSSKNESSSESKALMERMGRNTLMIVIVLDLPPCYVHGYLLV